LQGARQRPGQRPYHLWRQGSFRRWGEPASGSERKRRCFQSQDRRYFPTNACNRAVDARTRPCGSTWTLRRVARRGNHCRMCPQPYNCLHLQFLPRRLCSAQRTWACLRGCGCALSAMSRATWERLPRKKGTVTQPITEKHATQGSRQQQQQQQQQQQDIHEGSERYPPGAGTRTLSLSSKQTEGELMTSWKFL